jgi:hypothetical protein
MFEWWLPEAVLVRVRRWLLRRQRAAAAAAAGGLQRRFGLVPPTLAQQRRSRSARAGQAVLSLQERPAIRVRQGATLHLALTQQCLAAAAVRVALLAPRQVVVAAAVFVPKARQ